MDTETLKQNWLNRYSNDKTKEAYSLDLGRIIDNWPNLHLVSYDQVALIVNQILANGSANTTARRVSALKSFFRYLQEAGHREDNPTQRIKIQKAKDDLAERIISETEVHKILAKEENSRNALLIELLYASGGRISEALSAKWKDTQEHEKGGQVTYFGKGNKTRAIIIPPKLWEKLIATKQSAIEDDYIFPSPRKEGQHLNASQAWRIAQKAGLRAIGKSISPHWFRHAHASHALDRGAPVSLVQNTMGHADLRTTSRYVHAKPNESSSEYLSVK